MKESKDGYAVTLGIFAARDLLACDFNGLSDPYVKCYINGEKDTKQKTSIKPKTLNPNYDDEFKWKLAKDRSLKVRGELGRGEREGKG